MSATFAEDRNVSLARYRLTVEDYHRMAEAGIFGEGARVELIEGELIQMPPIGAKHADAVDYINDVFSRKVSDDKRVRIQNPVDLNDFFAAVPPSARIVTFHVPLNIERDQFATSDRIDVVVSRHAHPRPDPPTRQSRRSCHVA